MNLSADLQIILPELALAIGGMGLLMLGVFLGDTAQRLISWAAAGLFIVVAGMVVWCVPDQAAAFGGGFIVDPFARFVKILILGGAALVLVMADGYMRLTHSARFEFPVLAVFSVTGMMLMVSANDFITLYMGLELQSLALYVLAAFKRDNLKSTEAGLKYFVLGALSSGMMLYGISLIYGFAGATGFETVAEAVSVNVSIGLVVGLVFLAAGLAFKISAVPFHMWTPDVYEGAPTPVTAFFSASPKIAAMALLLRTFLTAFPSADDEWRQIIVFISIASMALGAVAAIGQTNIKRLMAYSSIGHMGYALVGLAAGTPEGVQGVLVYLAIYVATNIGVFACILAMRKGDEMVEDIDSLSGLAQTRPGFAFALSMFMFSLAGIPPLAGFFAKFYVFMAAIKAELYPLAVIGVVASVVGAYYYLRIVKIIYFDPPAGEFSKPMSARLSTLVAASGLFTFLFIFGAAPLSDAALAAAQSLFP